MNDIKDKILLYGNGINYFISDLVKEKLNFNRLEIDEFIKSDYFNKFFTKNFPNRQVDEFKFSKNLSFEEKFKKLSDSLGLYEGKTPKNYKIFKELNLSFQNWLLSVYDKNRKIINDSKISIQKDSLYQKLQLKVNEYDYLTTTNYIDSFPLISGQGKITLFIHGIIKEKLSNILPLDGNMPWYKDKKLLFEDEKVIDQYPILVESEFESNVFKKLKNVKEYITYYYENIKHYGTIYNDELGQKRILTFEKDNPKFNSLTHKVIENGCVISAEMDIFGFSPINDDKLVKSILDSECINKINIYIYDDNYDLERKIWDKKIILLNKKSTSKNKKEFNFEKSNHFLK